MKDNLLRLNSPKMVNYHYLYCNSVRWNGDRPLKGKRVILYGEQGCGDVIQFLRYIPYLLKQECELYIHAHAALRSLVEYNFKIAGWIDKEGDESLPPHDYHILSLSMPFLLGFIPTAAYLTAPEKPIEGFDGKVKIGIAWEGNPSHTNNFERSCPLKWFKALLKDDAEFFMIQREPNLNWFLRDAEEFPLNGVEQHSFLDTAALIKQMDFIVTVDTAALHVAGALGIPTFGLMSRYHDPRWKVGNWYPSLMILRQARCDDWQELLIRTRAIIDNKSYSFSFSNPEKIVVTGGIGDWLTLKAHMASEFETSLKKVYLATRANREIATLIAERMPQVQIETIWSDFHNLDAFDRKGQITEAFAHHYEKTGVDLCPKDWYEVEDYSIQVQFQNILDSGKELAFAKKDDWVQQLRGNEYVLICPASGNIYSRGRNFDKQDWENTIEWLEKWKMTGIVIGTDCGDIPEHRLLRNKTDVGICEARRLAENCGGYIGIDSWASVVATKHLQNRIWIKSISEHLREFVNVYYAPHKDPDFVLEKIPGVL
jgi:hypothetical protein